MVVRVAVQIVEDDIPQAVPLARGPQDRRRNAFGAQQFVSGTKVAPARPVDPIAPRFVRKGRLWSATDQLDDKGPAVGFDPKDAAELAPGQTADRARLGADFLADQPPDQVLAHAVRLAVLALRPQQSAHGR